MLLGSGGLDGLGSPHISQSAALTQFAEPPAGWRPVYWLGSGADTAAVGAGPPWLLYGENEDTSRAIDQPLHVNGQVAGILVVTLEYPSETAPNSAIRQYGTFDHLTGVLERGDVEVELYVDSSVPLSTRPAVRAQALRDLQPIPTN